MQIIGTIWISLCIISFVIVVIDLIKHPQMMKIMNLVYPINALWGGPILLWVYFTIGKHRMMKMDDMNMSDMKMDDMDMSDMKMGDMDMKMSSGKHYDKYWQGIVLDALHCGAGCTLADLIGPWIFMLIPFALFGNLTFGEWTLDYTLALFIGATFQYAAISPMLHQSGIKIWLKALKIDFLSLTSWQVGMYGFSALVIFVFFGRLSPFTIEYWFMMQIAMMCGFATAYPMNWWMVKKGIKSGM